MDQDDLKRRLEKLTALKEHPSTLPVIRDEAARAEERLRAQIHERVGASPRHNQFRRSDYRQLLDDADGTGFADFLQNINRETAKLWPKIRPAHPSTRG